MDTGTVLVPYWVLQWHNRGRRGANKPTNTFKNKPTPLPVSSFDATYPPVPCLVRATGGRHHPAGSGETRRLPGAGPSRRAVPVAVEGPSALSTSPPPGPSPLPLDLVAKLKSRPIKALPGSAASPPPRLSAACRWASQLSRVGFPAFPTRPPPLRGSRTRGQEKEKTRNQRLGRCRNLGRIRYGEVGVSPPSKHLSALSSCTEDPSRPAR
jgi:hypothetical protein